MMLLGAGYYGSQGTLHILRHSSKNWIVAANRRAVFIVLRFRVAHLVKVRLERRIKY